MIAPLAKFIDWSVLQSAFRRTTMMLLLVVAPWNVFSAEAERFPQSIPELKAAIEAILRETRTPGAAIAIVSRDKVEWVAGIGKADVAANKMVPHWLDFKILCGVGSAKIARGRQTQVDRHREAMAARSGL
jgi:CubicO group peptidase (beta-lactamase class C family)